VSVRSVIGPTYSVSGGENVMGNYDLQGDY